MTSGIEVSRRFYGEIVAPWLQSAFPHVRRAAALIGYGSELLGFDDAMSKDHDFGPRVQIYVPDGDFAEASRIVPAFTAVAPETFLDHPIGLNRAHPAPQTVGAVGDDRHGVEVWTLSHAVAFWLGRPEPMSAMDWLGIAEQRLLSLTAGAVFRDDLGELTALRARLSRFPRDVWLYKLACQWQRIAEEQAFVGRAGYVGDDLGSRVIAARLARDVMRLALLIEGQYAPYPKWLGSAFARLPCAAYISPMLQETLAADTWQVREAALARAYLALAEQQGAKITVQTVPRIGPYFGRPFTVINADELAAGLRALIADPELRATPLIGSLDQVTDSTAVVQSPARAAAAMEALLRRG